MAVVLLQIQCAELQNQHKESHLQDHSTYEMCVQYIFQIQTWISVVLRTSWKIRLNIIKVIRFFLTLK